MSKDENPVVVAVIPTHNHKRWIFPTLISLQLQHYLPTALVVVDDGSSDGTLDALLAQMTELQKKEWGWSGDYGGTNLVVARNEEARGPAAARNLGARLASQFKPDLLAFCDSDDYYEQAKIYESVAAWKKAPETIGVVYSDYYTVNSEGLSLRNYKEPYSTRLLQECIINCDSLISWEAFQWAGGFPEDLRVCEDYALWLKICQKYLAYHIPEPLVNIRVGSHSSSATVPTEQWQSCYRKAFEWAGYKLA